MSVHPDAPLTRGDTWVINGNLLDSSDLPLDLTALTIQWALKDQRGNVVLILPNANHPDSGIQVTGIGNCRIQVDRSTTENFVGIYTDALRVIDAGQHASTLWNGRIIVADSPFL